MNEIKTNKEGPIDESRVTTFHIIYIRNDRQYSVLLILPLKENGLSNIPLLESVSDVDDASFFAGSKVGAAVTVITVAFGFVVQKKYPYLRLQEF